MGHFIPRIPRRFDFCGCPPCPLCFVWVDDDSTAPPISGVAKLLTDMRGWATEQGRDPAEVTEEDAQQVAEKIHAANLASKADRDAVIAERKAEDEQRHFEMQLGELARQRESAKKHKSPRPTLDQTEFGEKAPPEKPQKNPKIVEVKVPVIQEWEARLQESLRDEVERRYGLRNFVTDEYVIRPESVIKFSDEITKP